MLSIKEVLERLEKEGTFEIERSKLVGNVLPILQHWNMARIETTGDRVKISHMPIQYVKTAKEEDVLQLSGGCIETESFEGDPEKLRLLGVEVYKIGKVHRFCR